MKHTKPSYNLIHKITFSFSGARIFACESEKKNRIYLVEEEGVALWERRSEVVVGEGERVSEIGNGEE